MKRGDPCDFVTIVTRLPHGMPLLEGYPVLVVLKLDSLFKLKGVEEYGISVYRRVRYLVLMGTWLRYL